MSMVLFAIIGAKINAGAGYWICYGIFCAIRVCKAFTETIKEHF